MFKRERHALLPAKQGAAVVAGLEEDGRQFGRAGVLERNLLAVADAAAVELGVHAAAAAHEVLERGALEARRAPLATRRVRRAEHRLDLNLAQARPRHLVVVRADGVRVLDLVDARRLVDAERGHLTGEVERHVLDVTAYGRAEQRRLLRLQVDAVDAAQV